MKLIDVLYHHLNGGKFEYKTYDFKKTVEYFKTTNEGKVFSLPMDHWNIPNHIKEKFSYWRIGKVRSMLFFPDGSINRIYIGAKRAKAFYHGDLHNLRLI